MVELCDLALELFGVFLGCLSIIVYYAWKLRDPWWLLRHHDS